MAGQNAKQNNLIENIEKGWLQIKQGAIDKL